MDRFRVASRAYLTYGVVYWIGGFYLATQGVGVRGERMMQPGVAWILIGLVLVAAIPYLLGGRRAWFERWVLTRRDFARILTAFMLVRAWHVLRVAIRPETASVPAPRPTTPTRTGPRDSAERIASPTPDSLP